MGNGAPAMIRERLNGKIFTAAECRKIAERKMGEAIGDRRHGKELHGREAMVLPRLRLKQPAIVLINLSRRKPHRPPNGWPSKRKQSKAQRRLSGI
jgi:hypothetical protein